ncbi:MAG: class I SAM-dependent methyltransferase [Nitrospirae bacterium]|nr:class I SAM-dependent methyltransferase [Nitrospirota bacterium]
MPTSTYSHIPAIIRYLHRIMPSSVLDIGVGNGKMGFIVRDFLDVMLGERYKKEEWKIKIDGIEVFSGYIQAHHRAIYDNIYIGDAFEAIDKLGNYDAIILGDVLEHFEKEKAWQFLEKCFSHCNNSIILNIPLGEGWTQPAIYGNQNEEHLSFWRHEELEDFAAEKELFNFEGLGYYGCFLITKGDFIHHCIRQEAESMSSNGTNTEAITYMNSALSEVSPNITSEYLLIDLLLKTNRIMEAIERLKIVMDIFPKEDTARKYFLQLQGLLKSRELKVCQ